MKMLKISCLFLALASVFPLFTNGQNYRAGHQINICVPDVALLRLVSEKPENTNLFISAPDEAGNSVNLSGTQEQSVIWINYSSVAGANTLHRTIVASVQNQVPSGLRLLVEASEATGEGRGKLGRPTGRVALSGEPSEVIVNIGSCYTGKGVQNGHRLTYILEPDAPEASYALLTHKDVVLNVVYTLTDNN